MAANTGSQPALTTGQLAAMTPAQQQSYLSSLDAQTAAQQQTALQAYKAQSNASYLALCAEKIGTCFPASGGITQNYVPGQTLIYNFPTASGAFAKDLLITANINLTPAAGTAMAYAYTASGFYGLFNEIQILFNGTQARVRPYLLKVMEMGRARSNPTPSSVVAGQSIAALNTALSQFQPTLTAGSPSQINALFRVPLNALHALSPVGMLPIQGAGTKAQIIIMCSSAVFGSDPMLNAIFPTAGTAGGAVAINAGSTVKVEAIYMDGTNYNSPQPLSLDLVGVPTAQYIIDTPLTPLAAGIVIRQRIATLLQHYLVIAVVMDGLLSSTFAAVGNIVGLELDQDSVGQNKFWQYGTANNVSVNDFWERIRHLWTQDFDQGVIPFIWAQSYGQENPDNRMGNQILNMTAGGWTDVHHGYILTAVNAASSGFNGATAITGRVELYLVSLNPAGIVMA